jgi:hypothetical protein
MKKNPVSKGILAENFTGIGPVTRAMVHTRALELALINGRTAREMSQSDWEQARRELAGGSDLDAKEVILESAPESLRWDPVPGSRGHQAPESPSEDEDEEGRSETEQLVDQGVAEAEHDQMLQAAKDAEKKDRTAP